MERGRKEFFVAAGLTKILTVVWINFFLKKWRSLWWGKQWVVKLETDARNFFGWVALKDGPAVVERATILSLFFWQKQRGLILLWKTQTKNSFSLFQNTKIITKNILLLFWGWFRRVFGGRSECGSFFPHAHPQKRIEIEKKEEPLSPKWRKKRREANCPLSPATIDRATTRHSPNHKRRTTDWFF